MPEKTALPPHPRVQRILVLVFALIWKGMVLILVCLKFRSLHLNGNVFGHYRSQMLNVHNCPRSVREMMKTFHLSHPTPSGVSCKVAERQYCVAGCIRQKKNIGSENAASLSRKNGCFLPIPLRGESRK